MGMLPHYKVNLCDADYFRESIKCQNACPVGTDACGYVRAITEGDFEKAYLIARGPNPLASICGRVCGARCEAACRRCDIDQAVSIRTLKRFAAEQYNLGPDGFDPLKLLRKLIDSSELRGRVGCEDLAALAQALSRRYTRLQKGEGKLPDILLIDGGKGQVGKVKEVLDDLGSLVLDAVSI